MTHPRSGDTVKVHYTGRLDEVVRIAEVSDEQVTIDANHPLAGQNLTFDLELVEIRGQGPRRRD
ncbi:MAG TPA: hypothetical protein VIK60_08855 [Vicinamibacterales bacterium]